MGILCEDFVDNFYKKFLKIIKLNKDFKKLMKKLFSIKGTSF